MWLEQNSELGQSAVADESIKQKAKFNNHSLSALISSTETMEMVQQLEIDPNLYAASVQSKNKSGLSKKSQFAVEQILEMELVIANDVVKPLIFLLNYVFPFPAKITFDSMSRRFIIHQRYWLRKIICVFWQLVILWRLAIKAIPSGKETSSGIFSKSPTMVKIINRVIDVSHDLCLKFRSPPRTRLVQFTAHSSWMFVMGFSFVSHVLGGFLALLNNKHSHVAAFGYGNLTDPRYQLNEMDPGLPKVVHAIIIIANFLNTFNWMMSFLYIGIWAIVFRQLFIIFFWKIEVLSKCGCELNLPKEIRTFHKIESLVDSFNDVSGVVLLFGSTVAVLYISTSIEEVLTGIQSVAQSSQKLHLMLSYIPVVAATLIVSDLHRVANTFSTIVKEEYGRWNKVPCERDLSEDIFGISIVHHDIATSNIGFKGLAFFTVTYQFVTTMLGLIITYSLVVIQFFPKVDNSADHPAE